MKSVAPRFTIYTKMRQRRHKKYHKKFHQKYLSYLFVFSTSSSTDQVTNFDEHTCQLCAFWTFKRVLFLFTKIKQWKFIIFCGRFHNYFFLLLLHAKPAFDLATSCDNYIPDLLVAEITIAFPSFPHSFHFQLSPW